MNSILGESFALGGLGSISKCNENLFKEKQDNKRDYNYCLNGQKLLLVDPSNIYGSTNSEYKTAINTQSKIIKKANHWEVYTKDGLIYEYGNNENSNENPNSKISNIIYKLSTIKDRYSNQIRYYYHQNNHQVSNSIKKIEYSNSKIEFIYENRSDKRALYFKGTKKNINQRLKQIIIKTNNKELSSINIEYETNTHQSKIKSIQKCLRNIQTNSNEFLQPVEFSCSDSGKNDFGEFKLWFSKDQGAHSDSYITGSNSNGVYSALMDMNGDGLPDRVGHHNYNTKTTGLHVALNRGKPSKITAIKNSKDEDLRIVYSTLKNSSVYSSNQKSTHPNIAIKIVNSQTKKRG